MRYFEFQYWPKYENERNDDANVWRLEELDEKDIERELGKVFAYPIFGTEDKFYYMIDLASTDESTAFLEGLKLVEVFLK